MMLINDIDNIYSEYMSEVRKANAVTSDRNNIEYSKTSLYRKKYENRK